MQMDSDLVIYRTTLVRTFQVVTICRVDKSEDIGSLATLDLPMVVDLFGIYVLKGPYYTLTTTNWFLQALSVIPRGSWRDTHNLTLAPNLAAPSSPSLTHAAGRRLAPPCAAAVRRPLRDRTCFDHRDEVFPIVPKSISFLVQAYWRKIESGRGPDWRIYRRLPLRASSLVILVGARRLDASKVTTSNILFARTIDRYDDVGMTYSLLLVVVCVAMVTADQQARKCKSVEKWRRFGLVDASSF
ncbi:hypothetical protein F511_31141 [Dorcoceras hygrometricum]|uniref:Uncharacterized protein n=1 Tax=Dorcoceras hygrometricum TaxID=472368 RepID=A0A2Z7B8X5_9LAMI|nr:hypothetical protein F511_31141 [Dorcoceras hygrometricum]